MQERLWAALTDDDAVLRVLADELRGLVRSPAPGGQRALRPAVGVVQVEAVDAAAAQHWLALHGAAVAEIPCRTGLSGRAGGRSGGATAFPTPYLCKGWCRRSPRRET